MAAEYPDFPGGATGGSFADRYVTALAKASAPRPQTGLVSLNFWNTQPTVAEIRATSLATGSPIPIAYGQVQIGGRGFAIGETDGWWTVGVAFCVGEIDSYVELLINGEPPKGPTWDITTGQKESVSVNYYTGTTAQTADPLLAAAITGYADTLVASTPNGSVGIAYVVVQYRACHYDNWPTFVAELKGKKVWNPATSTTVYSANPALMLGDLLRSTIYGAGYTVDDTDLDTAMDYCDETVTSEARRQCGLVLDGVQDTDAWIEIVRGYASCWVVLRGGTAHLVPDKAASSVQTFDEGDIIAGTLRVTKADSSNLPTVVRVQYTDTTGTEWKQADVVAKRPGVDAGTTPWRESVVNMVGITRYSQANREAIERLNKLWLSDLSVEFETFDEGLEREAGDVITVTHFLGLASKALRIVDDPEQVRPGRWRIRAVEYDAAAYSNAVASTPSTPDTNLPEVGPPTAVTGLALTEVNYRLQNGKYASRVDAEWDAHTNGFVTGYQVTVRKGSEVVASFSTRDTRTPTPPVQELVAYQVDVAAVTPLYTGAVASAVITVVGKTAVPDGPQSLSGYEVASEVRLQASKDTSDFDIERYAYRYGLTTDTWDDAQEIDERDSLTLETKAIPAGTWRFFCKSVDSVGQYSANAAYCDIEVTLNENAYLVNPSNMNRTTGSTTLLHSVTELRTSDTVTHYSDGGDSWSTLFGAAAMSTFTDPIASYQTASGTSEWYSDELDLGADYTGDWLATCAVVDYFGTATVELGLKPAAGSYTYGNLSQKGTARYAKIRVQSTGIFGLQVPGPTISLRVIARETNGSDTSSASAVVTVDIGIAASAFKSISVVPLSDTQYTVSVSNADTSGATATFDVSIRDTAGARQAVSFLWATRTV